MNAADCQPLEEFLCRVIRQPTEIERSRDPGVPIARSLAREAITSLTDRQLAAIDVDVLAVLAETLEEITRNRNTYFHERRFEKTAPMLAIRKLDTAIRAASYVTWAVVHSLILKSFSNQLHHVLANQSVIQWLHNAMLVLRQLKMYFTHEQYRGLVDCDRAALDSRDVPRNPFTFFSLPVAVDAMLAHHAKWTLSDNDRADLQKIRNALRECVYAADERRRLTALEDLIGDERISPLWEGEPWAATIGQSLTLMPSDARRSWLKVLAIAGTCNPTKPSKPWLKEASATVAMLPDGALVPQLEAWLRAYLKYAHAEPPPAAAHPMDPARWRVVAEHYRNRATNNAHLIGLISLTLVAPPHPRFATLLADVAERVGRAKREARDAELPVAAVAVRVLAAGGDDESLAQLSRLEMRVRWPKLKKIVRKELDQTIKRRGLDRAQVEEALIPDFGLRDGTARLAFQGVSAELTLGRADKPSVAWKLADGKSARSLPPRLKAENPGAAEEVKQTVTDIERMRAAQRTRLDLLMRRPRSWPGAIWRERYLDHGLVGTLARRLIWLIDDTPAIWREGSLVDVDGKPVALGESSTIRIWHPAQRAVDEVVAWRSAIEAWEIVQPFKQAYREIYLLTDAERRTATYSNRFAAHIVRSMMLLSISQVRQWKSGMYGGASSPSFELADHGLRAEWWLNPVGDEHTPYGAPLYLASDQVRFVCTSEESARRFGHADKTHPLPLDRVPPLVLSEIMRDVDLFVAMASVGNDPNWSDGGPGARFRDYWHQFSFGDLTESAKTRKAALERLVPRLAIRDRCRLSDKFLIVRGDIRTYKIHLGSGNILMEPNDQYLCIVPDSSARKGESVFLPFEGDATLSVILSKAFLLVADTQISDPTITRQIRRAGV